MTKLISCINKVYRTKGLRRDLNPPQAVSVLPFLAFTGSSPQPPILTRLYYEGHFISSAIMVIYIISKEIILRKLEN